MRDTAAIARLRRVLLVGGTTVSRVLVESILAESADFIVVGALGNAVELDSAVDELRPDLVVIDLCMAQLDGVAVLKCLSDRKLLRKLILLKEPASDVTTHELKTAGADAIFIKKDVANAHDDFREQIGLLFEGGMDPESAADEMTDARVSSREIPEVANVVRDLPVLNCGPSHGPSLNVLPRHDGDEDMRLTALSALHIANLETDRRLDAIVRHLCHISGYPMAAVTLIDGSTQWIKAAYGFSKAATPRNAAICNHTIMSTTPLIVSDALEHPIFRSYECVVSSPFIRSYVGVPLLVECGLPIGAVCLLDHQPRALVQSEIRLLADMADLIVQILDPRWQREAA